MTREETRFTLRIDKNLFERIKVLAAKENRSAVKQIEFILKSEIGAYEEKRD